MTFENVSNLGKGGAGMQGQGAGSVARAIKELQGLQVSLVTGGAANSKLALAAITPRDTLIAAHNNNAGVLTDVTATTTISDNRASGTVTAASAGTAGDTVSIAGLTYTLVAANATVGLADKTKVKVAADAAGLAANLMAAVQAREANRDTKVTVSRNAAVLTITAYAGGTDGNALALAETGNSFNISGATLSGGSATGGVQVTSVTNQLVVYWFKKP